MKPIFLIGFMGSGKSTVGKCLARQKEYQFVDTDLYFEEKEQISISNFFSQNGEAAFRSKEQMYLKTCTKPNTVVSTGGGIVLHPVNIDWMRESGIVVYLETSFSQICHRLKDDQTRPLFQVDHLIETEKRFNDRLPLYQSAAHYVIATAGKTPIEIAQEIQTKVTV